jgi:hypothetical protein
LVLLRYYLDEQLKGNEIHKYTVVMEKLNGIDSLENLSIDGGLILIWVLNKWDGTLRIEFVCFRTGTNCMLLLTL